MPEYQLVPLGAGFPPGLNTAQPATDIEANETPDGYGFDLSKDGVIAAGTIPSGTTARVQKTITISTVPYYWHYARLWNITGLTAASTSNILRYGAPEYTNVYLPQRSGAIPLDEDSNPILALVPLPPDSLACIKTSGTYVISNCSDGRAFFQRTDLIQEINAAAAANVAELDGVLYVCNASGLFSLVQGKAIENTRKVRDGLTNFASKALTVDQGKQYIVGGTTFAYEPATQKLFRYSGSSFRYTTRQLVRRDYEPFAADRMVIAVEHTTTTNKACTYQYKIGDEPWSQDTTLALPYEDVASTLVFEPFAEETRAHKFQLRFTSLDAGVGIKAVWLDIAGARLDDYAV